MSGYKVSCVVLNYNDASTTIQLLNRIRSYENIDDIIVVDNCSTDDSLILLNQCNDDKVHVVMSSRNGGYGFGNNLGIRVAVEQYGADYVLIANPDVIFDNDFVARLAEAFQQGTDIAVVSAKQSNSSDCAWKDCGVLQYVLSASLFFEVWLKIRNYPKSFFAGKTQVEVFAVPGSLLMVDAAKMIQHGMYDEEFFLYYEEPVLGQKFYNAGLKTILRLDASYIHNHHVSISKTYRRWSQQHKILLKSAELFLRKYKKANVIQMAFANLWFAYTRAEFGLYDLYRSVRVRRG